MFVDYDMLDACLTSCNRERLDSIGIPRNEVILDKVECRMRRLGNGRCARNAGDSQKPCCLDFE